MGLRRPVGRRRGDRAVERGADPLGPLDRRAARARQHGRAEAVGVVAGQVGGLLWGEVFAEAGLPAGVLNIVTHAPGEAQPIGDELVENPRVRRLNFTGSTATGRKLAEAAGRQLKRVVLELGGYNPLIVLADADLEYAVNATDVRRVPPSGADLHVGAADHRRAPGRRGVRRAPRREDARPQGRRSEGARHDHRAGHQRRGARDDQGSGRRGRAERREGARRRRGRRAVLPPTLLADVPADSEFANDETFGPVAAIEIVDPRRRRSSARTPRATGSPPGSSRRTPTAVSRSRRRSTPASSTSTTSRSATSRRCRSAASRTAGSAASAARAVVDEFTEMRWITVQRGSHPFPF